jgi:hypothetical protein
MSAQAEGGFYVRQREPVPSEAGKWYQPFRHETMDQAFNEAERLARLKGVSYAILQEVGVAEPVLRDDGSAERRQKLAFLQEQVTDIQAEIAALTKSEAA